MFLDSTGYLSSQSWILPDQCQASVDGVKQVGSDQGDVTAGKNIRPGDFPGCDQAKIGKGKLGVGGDDR